MQYIDQNAMLIFTAIAILFAGVMASGYAIFDEVLIESVMILLLFARVRKFAHCNECPSQINGISHFHQLIFFLFTGYEALQAVRGVFVLSDIRVLRFALMFFVLMIISWRWSTATLKRVDVCRTLVGTVIIYLIVYIGIGMIAETCFHISRYDLQGEYWSGTSVALFPVLLLVVAMSELNRLQESDLLFWLGFLLLTFATFYYQSRTAMIVQALFIMFGIMTISQRLISFLIFIFFIVFFPWDSQPPLTPTVISRSVQMNMKYANAELMSYKIERTWANIFGGSIVSEPKSAQVIKSTYFTKNDLTNFHANPIPHHDESTQDIDREIAVLAAWCTATHSGISELFFGSGYWTHRYRMIDCMQSVAARYQYKFPPIYNSIVRTATANGYLVDSGLLGCILFLLLFISTLLLLVKRIGLSYRCILPVSILGLMFVTLFVSLNYDVMLFYLMLMPGGALLMFYRNELATTSI